MNENTHTESVFLAHDDIELYTQSWRIPQPKASIVIVHGLGEYSRRYLHVAEFLNQQGLDVFSYDQRGHGRSQGPRAYVTDFGEFTEDLDIFLSIVRQQHKQGPLFLLGHSMGGTVCTLYCIRNNPQLDGLILSGPGLKIGEEFTPTTLFIARLLGRFAPKIPLQGIDHHQISRDPGVVANYGADPLVYHGMLKAGFGSAGIRAVQEIESHMSEISLPLLILHGTHDTLADPIGSQWLFERARSNDKQRKLYKGLYHEIFNEPEKEQVLGDLRDWLLTRI